MGLTRAILFSFLAAFPGLLFAVIGWTIIGMPEEWTSQSFLACYVPFFVTVGWAFILGIRGNNEVILEA
ncbi:MAG: hypothetical protein CL993_03415 [Euryarchaeota archaeon]|nr:hypothetical protein [Euryarchaeota archaeon]